MAFSAALGIEGGLSSPYLFVGRMARQTRQRGAFGKSGAAL
jgi:hypothetical protein